MKNKSLALQILRYQTKYEGTVLITIYSETCLSWPPTVPEKVVNLHKYVPK
jgi:hypothetical protein